MVHALNHEGCPKGRVKHRSAQAASIGIARGRGAVAPAFADDTGTMFRLENTLLFLAKSLSPDGYAWEIATELPGE